MYFLLNFLFFINCPHLFFLKEVFFESELRSLCSSCLALSSLLFPKLEGEGMEGELEGVKVEEGELKGEEEKERLEGRLEGL